MQEIITKFQNRQDLAQKEAFEMQEEIISGNLSKDEIIKTFELFDQKEMTSEEFIGITRATRENMIKVNIDFDCLDNCGTGGDCLNTFNISTVSAIICASAGIPMAKHGNRASSSKCGSADVLEELGVKIDLNAEQAKKCLISCGAVFMFAPNFHPALKYVKDARTEYGKITYFNILGPMLNPAAVKHQLIGVSDKSKIKMMGSVLLQTGSKRIIIIHSDEGMDEISVAGDTQIFDFKQGREMKQYVVNPKDFGFNIYNLEQIRGGDRKENAKIFLDILKNRASKAQAAAAILNSAAGMTAFGKTGNFQQGIILAKEQIETGKALKKLNEFIEISNSL
ncbi:anthranilate phosphoribosyltransferase [Candidatus Parcubacteria bacterium]|nr:anthranilate phosphoribosyltransferase [Candidatus Parcubacteria bacterium]